MDCMIGTDMGFPDVEQGDFQVVGICCPVILTMHQTPTATHYDCGGQPWAWVPQAEHSGRLLPGKVLRRGYPQTACLACS